MLQYIDINQTRRYWEEIWRNNSNSRDLTKLLTIMKYVSEQNYRKDEEPD
jgi:hypothetical protein